MGPPAYGGGPAHTGEVAFADAMGIPQTAPLGMGADPLAPTDFGRHDPFGRDMMPGSMHPSQQGMQPFARMGSPSYNGTMTSQRGRRRPPMWVVAALSCSIALLIAGLVVAVVMTASTPTKSGSGTKAEPSAKPGTGVVTVPSSTAHAGVTTTATATANTEATPPPPHAATAVTLADPAPVPAPPTTAHGGAATTTATAASPTTTAGRPAVAPVAATGGATPAGVKRPTAPAAGPPAGPAALGAITVVCMPKCSEITDNGAPFGTGNVFNKPVTAGRHALVLFSATTGVRKPMVVDVASGQTAEVRVSMEK